MKKLLYPFILVLYISCTYFVYTEQDVQRDIDCPEDLACTEVFVSITISVIRNNEPIQLSKMESINEATGAVHEFNFAYQDLGIYVILTDAQIDEVNKTGSNYTVKGYIDDQIVFEDAFIIGRDCCHIMLIEGVETITL